jgi:hypothetical protein
MILPSVFRTSAFSHNQDQCGHQSALRNRISSQSRIGGIGSTETGCDESEDPADLAGCPWQNPYVERLIDTVCRECLDQMLIFGEAHLRRILSGHVKFCNGVSTRWALGKKTPSGRTVLRTGVVIATKGHLSRS